MNIPAIEIGHEYVMTSASKANSVSAFQPKTIVEDGIAYQTTQIKVTSVKDSGEYFYIGYVPTRDDAGRCKFGYARIYKEGDRPYGVVKFEPIAA